MSANVMIHAALHDCPLWESLPQRTRDFEGDIESVRLTWICPVCGQKWHVTLGRSDGTGRRLGKPSRRWRKAQRNLFRTSDDAARPSVDGAEGDAS